MTYELETALLYSGWLVLGVTLASVCFLVGAAVAWRFQRESRDGGLFTRQPKGATGNEVPKETT